MKCEVCGDYMSMVMEDVLICPNDCGWMPHNSSGLYGAINDVKKFHEGVGAPMPEKPTVPPDERVRLRWNLIHEEWSEIAENMFDDDGNVQVNMVGVADGIADLIYVLIGTALEFGIPLDRVWNEVQRSNMDKFRDGKVTRREDGKILKPADWKGPDIEGCLK
jgi:predicted HAD superfamily Cof-like phosphohydrolase